MYSLYKLNYFKKTSRFLFASNLKIPYIFTL